MFGSSCNRLGLKPLSRISLLKVGSSHSEGRKRRTRSNSITLGLTRSAFVTSNSDFLTHWPTRFVGTYRGLMEHTRVVCHLFSILVALYESGQLTTWLEFDFAVFVKAIASLVPRFIKKHQLRTHVLKHAFTGIKRNFSVINGRLNPCS